MNFFKEYDDSQKNMSRWLPWECLDSEGVVTNKDGSFLGVFSYEKKEKQEDGKALQIFLRNLGTGWSWWSSGKIRRQVTRIALYFAGIQERLRDTY